MSIVYRSERVWITNTAPPPTIVNISNEKQYELKKEHDDNVDDVFTTNEVHKTEYKPE